MSWHSWEGDHPSLARQHWTYWGFLEQVLSEQQSRLITYTSGAGSGRVRHALCGGRSLAQGPPEWMQHCPGRPSPSQSRLCHAVGLGATLVPQRHWQVTKPPSDRLSARALSSLQAACPHI